MVGRKKVFLSIILTASFRSLSSVQNAQNLCQLLLKPLTKFDSQIQKIFRILSFGLGQIYFSFVSLMNETCRQT
jgi:hypothetical protein